MADVQKILIVDDEPAVRHFLQKVLRLDGHDATAVESGEDALACVAVEEFDLALVDLKLRGMDGIRVLAALKQRSPATPVIVLTAYASMETAIEALRQGAHDYLFKPCPTVDLRESVRTGLIKRSELREQRRQLVEADAAAHASPMPQPFTVHPEQDRFLQHGDLIVDPIRHLITLGDHLLELSPTEFGLLAYLVGQAPRVIPARELVREVQGYESDSAEARDVVRSHIYHIRLKVKSAAGREIIRTVRGVGYALREG